MFNTQHIIKPSYHEFKPRYVLFFDSETRPVQIGNHLNGEFHKLWFLCYEFCRIDEYGDYEIIERGTHDNLTLFWDTVMRKLTFYREVYLLAHNQQFDLAIIDIDYYADHYNLHCSKLVLDFGKVMIDLDYNDDGVICKLKIRDTLNYFPSSVEQLGKIVGEKKHDFPDHDAPMDVQIAYCARDVEIIRLFYCQLIKFTLENDFGSFAETIASQSFIAFRNRFMNREIFCHDRKAVINLEREAYHGGRVEAFYIGLIDTPIYKLDVNSMYPYVMKEYSYPVKMIYDTHDYSVADLFEAIDMGLLITAHVHARIDDNCIGIIDDNGRFIFPVGENVECYLSTPELLLLRDRINSVEYVAVYESGFIFSDFVDFFYEKKKNSKDNPTYAALYKLILNSLYGKFGQRKEEWIDVNNVDLGDETSMQVYNEEIDDIDEYRQLLGKVQKKAHVMKNAYNAMVGIAAHVTAYARCYLWRMMEIAGKGNVYYVDTDCLFCTEQGYINLQSHIDSSMLGYLKLEGIFSSGAIYGNKDYRLTETIEKYPYRKHTTKHKGVRKSAQLVSKNTYEQLKFNKWSVLSRRNIRGGILIQTTRKNLKRIYDKSTVQNTGWTIPLIINDDINYDDVPPLDLM